MKKMILNCLTNDYYYNIISYILFLFGKKLFGKKMEIKDEMYSD